jgi:hypothetical protein
MKMMVGSFLIVLSFLLFSRFLGLFGGSVIDRHLDQIVKGAINGQLFVVLVGARLLLFCHVIKVQKITARAGKTRKAEIVLSL